MMLIRASVKYSPIHGLGCFAEEDIKKGQMVWKFDSLIDLEFEEAVTKSYPASFQEFLKIYSYGQMKDNKKTLILCGDHAKHMNHSDTPNLIEVPHQEYGVNIAARDIKAGEELTCDYTEFDANFRSKLN